MVMNPSAMLLAAVASVFILLSTPSSSPIDQTYLVAIGKHADALPEWHAVADALRATHGVTAAAVVFDEEHPETLAAALAPLNPTMVGIVLEPRHAGRRVCAGIHQAMRALDADPLADTRWGVITARSAEGAMAVATHTKPLRISTAAGTADFPMALFAESQWVSEEAAHQFSLHTGSSAVSQSLTEKNVGDAFAQMLNAPHLDLVMSGGHATEKGLEIGFRKRAGWFGPRNGLMVVECADGRVIPVNQHAPKVWIGVGNCLMGHVNGPDSLAAVAIEDFGVRAHVGYVVVTWFGRGGWGTLDRFTKDPTGPTLNQAWHDNCNAIVAELAKRFPGSERFTNEAWFQDDVAGFERAVNTWATEHSVAESDRRDLMGLLWDRDAVIYLGDPAWDARIERKAP